MYVEKVTQIRVTKEEITILKQAENILQEVCDAFDTDCEGCPLYNVCSDTTTPSSFLYKCINALPKDREEEK